MNQIIGTTPITGGDEIVYLSGAEHAYLATGDMLYPINADCVGGNNLPDPRTVWRAHMERDGLDYATVWTHDGTGKRVFGGDIPPDRRK